MEDYKQIINYLAINWNLKIAEKFIEIVDSKLRLLTKFPFIGIETNNNKTVRSILITKHNRLFYQINNETIEVLNIFDTRQNPESNPF